MRRTCWLSVDFDYFVRSLGSWDWGHRESPFFQSGFIWQTRVAPFIMQGVDLREEMDPETYAEPKPSQFWDDLQDLNYNLDIAPVFAVGDSHAGAAPFFDEVARRITGEPADVLINFDAHHDLGYCEWARINEMLKEGVCTCDMWLCALMKWWPQLESRIVFPDWMKEEYIIEKQLKSLEALPRDVTSRVDMDFFSDDEEEINPVVIESGEQLDVQAVFVCRSSAWVPPWLDEDFVQFVRDGEDEMGSQALSPFKTTPMEPRTDFDYDQAVLLAEQWKLLRSMPLPPPNDDEE